MPQSWSHNLISGEIRQICYIPQIEHETHSFQIPSCTQILDHILVRYIKIAIGFRYIILNASSVVYSLHHITLILDRTHWIQSWLLVKIMVESDRLTCNWIPESVRSGQWRKRSTNHGCVVYMKVSTYPSDTSSSASSAALSKYSWKYLLSTLLMKPVWLVNPLYPTSERNKVIHIQLDGHWLQKVKTSSR